MDRHKAGRTSAPAKKGHNWLIIDGGGHAADVPDTDLMKREHCEQRSLLHCRRSSEFWKRDMA